MERAKAIARLRKTLGKGFGYRINSKALSSDKRDEVRLHLPMLKQRYNEAREAKAKRFRELLDGDSEYKRLTADCRAAETAHMKASYDAKARKITVGVSSGMFFLQKAEGDSWEEIFGVLGLK